MRFVPPHDQTLSAAFKAAAITFLTAWLIPGKRACKAGTRQGEARLRLTEAAGSQFDPDVVEAIVRVLDA